MKRSITIIKWFLISVVIGIVGGLVGTAFHLSVDLVTEVRMENNWLVYLLPLAGLLIAFIYKKFHAETGIDTNRVIKAVKTDIDVPFKMAPLIFSGTVLTHLFGGSAGREGAALQLGGSIGYNISKSVKTDKSQTHLAVMAGMSAVFSALFGTPVAAAIFSFEVARVRLRNFYEMIPCFIASIIARLVAGFFKVAPIRFSDMVFPDIDILIVLKVALISALCGIVAFVFCYTLHKTEHLAKKVMPNIYTRSVVCGAIIAVLTFVVRSYDYNGAGMNIINDAIGGKALWYAFIIKILFTAITVAGGFKGGEIVPAFFIGSTLGCTLASLIGISPALGGCIGFVALFCGAVNCPFASILLGVEIFGGNGLIFYAIICIISYIFSGNTSLYQDQGRYSI